jgi:4-diphosphocytidyl-2-C-methyl-D-erythritol kinase
MLTQRRHPRAPGRAAPTVVVWAPAKVNLFLEIHARRPDGYHEIATLMLAVNLFDTLEMAPADGLSLVCDLPDLSTGPDNLVLRAAGLLRDRTGYAGGASIRLSKCIPLAAGLAGGSSDAAATLSGLNRLWRLRLPAETLRALAAELGSDVAFFFDTPAAWCTGRGEVVTPAPVGRPLHIVLVCPPFGLSTADVYRAVTVPASPRSGDAVREALAAGDAVALGTALHNRLQPAAESLRPEVGEWQRRLEESGAAGCRMSGSGSSLFAVCRDRREALAAARRLREAAAAHEPKTRVFVVRSCV